jgi:spermidine synthase
VTRRRLALALTFLTGVSGLVYEVTWQRFLATLLGSHSEATAAVLALFLGGLSLGYAWFGRLARGRPPRALLLLYAAVEGAIGLHALAFPMLFGAVQRLSFAIPHRADGAGFALDVALSALLVGPPAVLMGATVPVLTQALSRSVEDSTRLHAHVYGWNTLGAFAGALAAAFALIPALGLAGAVRTVGCANLAASLAFALAGLRSRDALPSGTALEPATSDAPLPAPRLAPFAAAALLAGFAMMALQTVAIRVGALSLGASPFTFATVVAVFVLCIGLGSMGVSAAPRIPPAALAVSQWALVALLLALYPLVELAPWAAHGLRVHFPSLPSAFHAFHVAVLAAGLLVLGAPLMLSGAALPLLFHTLRRERGDLGAIAGRLYGWNTIGSLLGALLGGYVLLFWLDLHHVYRIATAASAGAATLVTLRAPGLGRARWLAAAALPAAAALAVLPAWDPLYLSAGLFRLRAPSDQGSPELLGAETAAEYFRRHPARVAFYDDDPTLSVAVHATRDPSKHEVSIVNDGKSDGAVPGDWPTMSLLAIVPALLAEKAERSFVIGWGTGVTAGELAALDDTREVVVAEISSGIVAAAPFFDAFNHAASRDPKVRVVRSDAYRALGRSAERYDLIVSEPSNPWVTGVEMLYSREFLEAARARLAPGGVFAQWLHVYEIDPPTLEIVLRTYAAVFPEVAIWFTMATDVMLLGFDDAAASLDLERIERRVRRPDVALALRRNGIHRLPALLAHEIVPAGVLHASLSPGPLHTLLRPILNDRAARAFFVGGTGDLPKRLEPEALRRGREASLLRRWMAREGGSLARDDRRAVAREVCRYYRPECLSLLAQWRHDEPASPEPERILREHPEISIGERQLAEIAEFFDGAGPAQAGDLDPTEAARRASWFARLYHHAAPFDVDAFEAIWSRCRDADGGASCTESRARLERAFGSPRSEPQASGDRSG